MNTKDKNYKNLGEDVLWILAFVSFKATLLQEHITHNYYSDYPATSTLETLEALSGMNYKWVE
jgi:hypothetical protein